MAKFYRIEEKSSGKGPYFADWTSSKGFRILGHIQDLFPNCDFYSDGHPCPYQEESLSRKFNSNYRFGFQSTNLLKDWFFHNRKEKVLRLLYSENFAIMEYEIAEWRIVKGEKQSMVCNLESHKNNCREISYTEARKLIN